MSEGDRKGLWNPSVQFESPCLFPFFFLPEFSFSFQARNTLKPNAASFFWRYSQSPVKIGIGFFSTMSKALHERIQYQVLFLSKRTRFYGHCHTFWRHFWQKNIELQGAGVTFVIFLHWVEAQLISDGSCWVAIKMSNLPCFLLNMGMKTIKRHPACSLRSFHSLFSSTLSTAQFNSNFKQLTKEPHILGQVPRWVLQTIFCIYGTSVILFIAVLNTIVFLLVHF